jgi:hypothetical protein
MSRTIGRAELSNEAHSLRILGKSEDAEVLECLADLLSDMQIEVDDSFTGEADSSEYFLWEMLKSVLHTDSHGIIGNSVPVKN